jgi:hypothetical protein
MTREEVPIARYDEAQSKIRAMQPFRTMPRSLPDGTRLPNGTLYALSTPEYSSSHPLTRDWRLVTGRLTGADYEEFMKHRTQARDYIVYSYGTPIAWHDFATLQWYITTEIISQTTTKHQWLTILATTKES